jgi:hypothetical protein
MEVQVGSLQRRTVITWEGMQFLVFAASVVLLALGAAALGLLFVAGTFVVASRLRWLPRAALPLAGSLLLLLPLGLNFWFHSLPRSGPDDASYAARVFSRLTFTTTLAAVIGTSHFGTLFSYLRGLGRSLRRGAARRRRIGIHLLVCIAIGIAIGAVEGALVLRNRGDLPIASPAVRGALIGGLASVALLVWHGFNSRRTIRRFDPCGGVDRGDPPRDDLDAAGALVPRPGSPPGLSGRASSNPYA